MDRALLELHLREAEAHVALGERHLAQQRDLVAQLERDGRDASDARALLDNFEQLQAMHIADRDRLLAALATSAR